MLWFYGGLNEGFNNKNSLIEQRNGGAVGHISKAGFSAGVSPSTTLENKKTPLKNDDEKKY